MREEGPSASVIAGEPVERDLVARVLRSVGWRTVGLTEHPDLILTAAIDGDDPAKAGAAMGAVGRLRSHPGLADVPLVAWVPAPAGCLWRQGVDDVLARPCSPEQVRALLARWRPVDPSPTLERLATALGRAELQTMTAQLHAQITAASASLTGVPDRAQAHRIAGIAGMLGFPDLGEAWRAVAEGRSRSTEAARIASRLALAALARHQDSVAAASGSSTASRSAHSA